MRTSKIKKFISVLIILGVLTAVIAFALNAAASYVKTRYCDFTYSALKAVETTEELDNPYQGFYRICGYRLSDEADPFSNIESHISKSKNHRLVLIEINLAYYSDSALSDTALSQLDTILTIWGDEGKHIILRFLYDWSGENLLTEPSELSQITEHMAQVAPVVNEHTDSVYIMQGIFIGNWGEMHTSIHVSDENIHMLTNHLAGLIDPSIFLSVRTPRQWLTAAGLSEAPAKFPAFDGSLVSRLGLFNDGMLGSESDYGTYKDHSRDFWIDFQDFICDYLPNGGEVIKDNPYNDFENAVSDLRRMHVSYLNEGYDANVLDKWRGSTYYGNDCFNETDGFTYIKEHLGYRYVLRSDSAEFDTWDDETAVFSCVLENVGFGSCLRRLPVSLIIEDPISSDVFEIPIEQDLRLLSSGESLELTAEIPVRELSTGQYLVYLSIKDPYSDIQIKLANNLLRSEHGTFIGIFNISRLQEVSIHDLLTGLQT